MLDFMGQTWFMVLMAVILLGLIGLFLYLRNQRPEE
jgi:LPXTG-motif cell wall-anchored protein